MAAEKGKADGAGVPEHGGDGAEMAEERTQVVGYAAAIDVAKGFGMVCTRVPGSRPDRRRQKVWRVEATYGEVTALMDYLRCEGIQRLVLESTSDYWRIWYYLAEAAGLEVWLVNARDVKHLPGRGKSDTADCVWHCKLNERGMLRRSFVPPEAVRNLRALTRTRSRLAQDQARHQARVEKILEDALLKISVVISDLFGVSGRRFLDALVAGERSPAALAALRDTRLKASRQQLEEALTGRFRDIHATEIAVHLRLIDAINAEIALLDEQIGQHQAIDPHADRAHDALQSFRHNAACEQTPLELRALRLRADQAEVAPVVACSAASTSSRSSAWLCVTIHVGAARRAGELGIRRIGGETSRRCRARCRKIVLALVDPAHVRGQDAQHLHERAADVAVAEHEHVERTRPITCSSSSTRRANRDGAPPARAARRGRAQRSPPNRARDRRGCRARRRA